MSAAPARGTAAQRPRRPHHKRHRRAPEPAEPPDPDEPEEKRPKVNPIFLWASQQEQRIVEVRCEDYDKRNRIKLTKTAQGWRSIPRTTVLPTPGTTSSSSSHETGATNDSRNRHNRSNRHHHRRNAQLINSGQRTSPDDENDLRLSGVDRRLLLLQPRVVLQQLRPSQLPAGSSAASTDREDSQSDIMRVLDTTTASPAMATDTPTADLPDSPNRSSRDAPSSSSLTSPGTDSDTRGEEWSTSLVASPAAASDSLLESDEAASSSRLLDALRKTPGLSVSIAPSVPAATSSSHNTAENSESTPEATNSPQTGNDHVMTGLSISIPSYRYRPRSRGTPVASLKIGQKSPGGIEYHKVEVEDPDDSRSQGAVVQASPQPSGIPCSPAAGGRPASAYLERLLPSPPCSVSCSEDARNDLTLKGILASPSQLHRQPQHQPQALSEASGNEDETNETDAASELRELLRASGHLIPDPLLVPRELLPALAAAPATEIPRLLAARPELRLPQALNRPELLRDPDLLVISLAHLQHVLDHGEGPVAADRRPKLTCKPIGTLMPAPIDLSANRERNVGPLLRVRTTGLLKQESEVTSTAASPEDSQLWHPLFGSQKRHLQHHHHHHYHYDPASQSNQRQRQQPQQQQQQQQQQQGQQQQQNHASWHRATIAS